MPTQIPGGRLAWQSMWWFGSLLLPHNEQWPVMAMFQTEGWVSGAWSGELGQVC